MEADFGFILDVPAQHKLCICCICSWILDLAVSARSFVPPVGGSKLGENVAEMAGAVRCFNISFQLTTFTCITLGFRLVRPLSLQLYSHLTMHTIFNWYYWKLAVQCRLTYWTRIYPGSLAYKKACWLCRDSETLPMKLRILSDIFDHLSYINKLQLPSCFMAFSI